MFDSTNLTRNQFLIWTGHQASPQHSIYNEVTTFVIEGAVDRKHFERAMRHVVDRTDALRMVVREVDGVPRLEVLARGGYTPGYVDLSDQEDPQAALREWGRIQAAVPFDLTQRTFDAWLVKLSDDQTAWYLLQHHILSDATSMSIVFRRVSESYSRSLAGTLVDTEEFSRFEDYVAYEKMFRGSPKGRQAEAYWTAKAADRGEPVRFYQATDRAGVGSWEQERIRVELSKHQSQAIRELARRPGVHLLSEDFSVFSVFAAVLFSYLHRLSGHERITIGVPWQNRPAQFADTVGLLMEQDPFTLSIEQGDTFHALIRRAQTEALDVMRHLPYAAGNPGGRLYDVALNFLKVSIGHFAGMAVRPLWLHSGSGDGSLIVNVHDLEASGGFALEFDFSCEVFEADERRRAIQHVTNLINECLADVSRPIRRAQMLSDTERQRILVDWNATQREFPTKEPLHGLVERQACQTPDAVAVVDRDRFLSYGRLDADANRISRALRLQGVMPTNHVGVCLRRSLEVVPAILGALKAGAAVVPLDPGYPIERVRFMLADCEAAVVLTDRWTSGLLSQLGSTVRVIDVDALAEDGAAEAVQVSHRSGPDDPAYIIYTSGSTGRPKGVVVPHRGICNHVNWMSDALAVSASDRFLHKTSISFDAAMAEIFVPLNVGGAVVIGASDEGLDPRLLAADIEAGGVTIMQVVPSALRTLLHEAVDVFGRKSLRYVICGGEALERALAREFQGRYPDVALGNFYGPTEASIDATWKPLVGQVNGVGTVPVGRPIANTRCYVLDGDASPVPIGVVGQLYVAGSGLASGYWGRPELTAASFVDDPFHPGERMYATGDLARYLPNGELEYRGRLNEQVKVRGYRIELGEIESALAVHAEVSQCVVTVREDEPGDRRLVAYVVERAASAGAGMVTAATLREHLRHTLPEHMVPQHFVLLEAIPVLPNGKVDRRALPAPTEQSDGEHYVAPRSQLEAALAEIWCEVLRAPRVGVHDNFVDMGGHSLTATQVVSRIRATLGVDVSLRTLFESPTVAEQADAVAGLIAAQSPNESPSGLPIPAEGPAPLTYAQEGLWILDRLERLGGLYNIPMALQLSGPLNEDALGRALQKLVTRHDSLRTVIEDRVGGPVQVVLPHVVVPLPVLDVSGDGVSLSEQERAGLLEVYALEEFDLSRGPLLRARLLRISPESHVLQVVVHHIVSDGWSMDVLKRELGALYQAEQTGAATPLQPLATQFGAYAQWQRESLRGERLKKDLDYWKQALAGLTPIELPTDMPRLRPASFRGATQRLTVPAALAEELRVLARTQKATLFMVVLAAFKVLLMRYSGQEDLAVGAPVVGRERPELEGLIGYFLNTVVLRTDLSGNPTFEKVVERVRRTALDAYAHQALPFETLVATISPERQLGKNPLFQVMINYLDGTAEPPGFGALGVAELPMGGGLAKFPLTLYVTDTQSELTLALAHQLDLFSESWARVLLDQLSTLFKRILEAPGVPIAGYDLWDRDSIVGRPDPSLQIAVPEYPLAVDAIRDVAKRAPESSALCVGDQSWSYADLERISLGIAAELKAKGLQRGDVVAIHGERSPGVVMAMLATLGSGGVVLTVDSALPTERRELMVRTAGARWHVRVGDASLPSGDAIPGGKSSVVDVAAYPQRPSAAEGATADVARPTTNHGDDAAYIFFTSGSTGQPKAVLGTHKGLAQFLSWERSEFQIGPGDRVSNLISLSFDPLLRDIFLPLTSGATLCIPKESDLLDVVDWLRRNRITLMHATPSLLQAWIGQGVGVSELPALRWTVLAGEPLADVLIERWRKCCGHPVAVANLYGPTETTLARCYQRIEREPEPGVQPVGIPIPDTQVLVLNSSGVQCGVNEVGEVVIRTPFRSRGYLGLEEETRRRFRQNPFNNDPTDLLYFTGDVGRVRPDGRLVLAGRMDDQVKIRGVRVEPGEVAAVLARHEAVASAVVLPRRHDGAVTLAGYVALRVGASVTVRDLLRFLRDRLPSAYVPSTLDILSAMPLLPNGKVDRRALPEPGELAQDATYVPPSSPLEESLTELWSEVLGRSRVGITDNFFDVGGHSLAAMQLVARINATFHVVCPLRAVFEAPTIAGLARVVATLDDAKSRRSGHDAIVPVSRGHALPVTLSQRRMWLVQQLDPQTTAYNMRLSLRLRGPLDREALRKALSYLIRRHEAFRTTFAMQDGDSEPLQIIKSANEADETSIEFADLRGVPERDDQADRQLQDFLDIPFDLHAGPLHRVLVIRTEDEDHRFMLVMHHAIGDDWSFGILMRELESAYEAALHDTQPTLPQKHLDCADFAVWQRRRFSSDSVAEDLMHWVDGLKGASPLALPVDRTASADTASYAGQVITPFEPALVDAIQTFSNRNGVTPFVTLLSVFEMLLARICHQSDILVGSPIANRTELQTESMVGTFVNTLAMRVEVSGDQSFTGLLAKVHEVALDAFAHQDVPFDLVVDAVREMGGAQAALQIRAFFSVLNTPWEQPKLSGLDVELTGVRRKPQFDLSISVDLDVMPGFSLVLDGRLFEESSATRLAGCFEYLLRQVLQDPSRTISAYAIVDEGQQRAIALLNATETRYQRGATVADVFQARAALTLSAPAVCSEGVVIRYGELDARANQLAHALRARGVERGKLVGLCVQRRAAMVVAQLAVLKAGGAYVPLDPAYPVDRLAFMVDDARLTLLVTESALAAELNAPVETLLLDAQRAEIESASSAPLAPDAQSARPEDPAYVIYTSGSTGKPKGVVVPHRAVVNFLESMAREPGLTAQDRLVAVTTLSFDIAVLELLLPLTVGAQVVLASREQAVDGQALKTLLETSNATVMQATPATWRMLLDAGWTGGARFKALVGGEALAPDLAQQLCARTGELWNMYGPTETTVWSTCWRVREPEQGISIGTPIANTSVWILDEHGQLCPQGVPGEIYIGGEGVTSGYLHREALTAERFVADPFDARPGARLYRTGDRGRWRADGLLEHLGRLDFQVKVRGHRIELGEIESALLAHEAVSQCVVVAREDTPGDVRLVAYIVGRSGATEAALPGAVQWREHLKRTLPDYMVPQHFVPIDAIPTLPNGKTDRKALPKPQDIDGAAVGGFEPPTTPVEIAIAEVWQQVLGVDRVGVQDNFFDLGGHSLLVMRAVVAIEKRTGLSIAPRRFIFESLRQMAANVDGEAAPATAPSDKPAKPGLLRRIKDALF